MKRIVATLISIFIFCNGCIAYANNVSKSTDYDEIKRKIIRVKNKNLSNISAFTNRVFVNIKNKVNKRELLNKLVPNATIVETIQITGSILIEFETVEEAIDSIDILNKNKNVNYAEPVYVITMGPPLPISTTPSQLTEKGKITKMREMDILNKNGIIVGDPDGDLRESDEITRAEFAAVLCRAMGCENKTENDDLKQKNYFPDVPAEHWASGYINFAYESGAINGFIDGKFYPEEKVTNEQAVKMLIGAWGYGDEAEQNGGYPDGYLKIAKENRIFNAIEFDNKNASKRWVASVFVYGVLSMPSKNPAVNPLIKTVPIHFENIRNEND